MPLAGTFDSLALTDLLQIVHQSRMSGNLTVSAELEESRLAFREGVLISLVVGDPVRADIRPALLSWGYLSEAQLQRTLESTLRGQPLLAALRSQGLVSAGALRRVQALHAFETAMDLLFQGEGSFHFAPFGSGFRDDDPLPEQELLPAPV
ncbi:MAG TPA: DUF4388 domain-containing protein, partial [Myxococcota bacterium]|nr:DUF4388 domain-containing protein [Myxococcota bacterium]